MNNSNFKGCLEGNGETRIAIEVYLLGEPPNTLANGSTTALIIL